MRRNCLTLMALMFVGTSLARAQHARIPWRQVELSAQDLVEDTRRTYMQAFGAADKETSRRLFQLWASAEALGQLAASAPETAAQVLEAATFVEASVAEAENALRRGRVAGSVRASFRHSVETFQRLQAKLGSGGGYEEPEEPPAPDPAGALELTLASDGWHGNVFDRYTRLSGQFTGLSLRQADLIVTDAQGYSLWHRNNAFPEIQQFYATNKFIRASVVTIPFNQKFYLKWVPPDAAWIYVRLRDAQGNYKDQAIPIPR